MISLLRKRGKVFLLALVVLIVLEIVGGILFKQRANDWKSFTGKDSDFGIKTTISLPPGCIFNFTGSEWDLRCGEKDVWDYKTSVFRGKGDKLKNYYTDGSLEQWYKKYLNGDFFADYASQEKNIILKTIKHSIQSNNYFELTIKETNGQITTHYLYLQNNVVHIIQPLIINESISMIKKNIGIIFTSLESSITK